MTSLGLQLCGGGMLACAVFAGFHTADEPQPSDIPEQAGRSSRSGRNQVQMVASVPKRSEASRRADVSMATRLRENRKLQGEVTVGGMVERPGPVRLKSGMSLWEAVEAAGGPNPFGSIHRVTLFRNGRSEVLDLSNPKAAAFRLEPNDAVEVPQKMVIGR